MDLGELARLGLAVGEPAAAAIRLGWPAPSSPGPRGAEPLRAFRFEDVPSQTDAGVSGGRAGEVPPLRAASGARARRVRVATWNVLAPSYALAKSFPDVERDWLSWRARAPRAREALEALAADVLCLQEVEAPEDWRPRLLAVGLDAWAFVARPERADGCLLAWRSSLFRQRGELAVSYDDAVASAAPPACVASRFTRRNVGLVVELEAVAGGGFRFLLATTHLYWGMDHEDVRSWQLQVLLETARARFDPALPLALCGDLNTLPGSRSCSLLGGGSADFPRTLRGVERFLFDRDISKACRVLRLLGLDAAVEGAQEREARPLGAKDGGFPARASVPLFARAAREGRLLVSACKKLLERSDCPPAYFLDVRTSEASTAEMLRRLSVDVRPGRFFGRCVKCNGEVRPVGAGGPASGEIPPGAPADEQLHECTACQQVYWFSLSTESASARAQRQIQAVVDLLGPLEAPGGRGGAGAGHGAFLRDGGGRLGQPWALRSAYEDLESGGAQGLLTNSKLGFHGWIDYVWLSPALHAARRRRLRPLSASQLGATLPLRSLVGPAWPSDHWPLAVDLELPVASAA